MKNDNEIRFVYVRDFQMDGETRPLTIAYRFNDEAQQIEYNSAACSPKDQFVKATGRLKATARLTKGVKKPNGAIPYSAVSDDTGPKYNLIAAELHAIHTKLPDVVEGEACACEFKL